MENSLPSSAPSNVGATAPTISPEADRVIREDECLRLTGLSRTTRWRLERQDRFPRRLQLSDNAVGWLLSELLAWRTSRLARTRAA
jgi:prophage regulatory protein